MKNHKNIAQTLILTLVDFKNLACCIVWSRSRIKMVRPPVFWIRILLQKLNYEQAADVPCLLGEQGGAKNWRAYYPRGKTQTQGWDYFEEAKGWLITAFKVNQTIFEQVGGSCLSQKASVYLLKTFLTKEIEWIFFIQKPMKTLGQISIFQTK
jgi:hypothetical protein